MFFAVNLGVAVELELAAANLRFAAEMCVWQRIQESLQKLSWLLRICDSLPKLSFLQRISIRCRIVCLAVNL
jgi:hypothetical protein